MITKRRGEITRVLTLRDPLQRLTNVGRESASVTGNTPEPLGPFVEAQIATFTRIGKDTPFKFD